MTEGTKTGIFCGAAVIATALATFVAWPTPNNTEVDFVGKMLFEKFEDPLAAASMKIVTFDEAQGQLETFEVRKDRESGLWTIPSRDGYPADAIEQMKDAANALVGIKILDVQTANAEDHDDLGVIEPKVETLEVGDEGVGRLVTFKDEKQETLATLIIGDSVKDDDTKRYVRIPNQDPVYVVKFDESPLTTNFRDWIEDDLLQLSSIDIDEVQVKDYTASIGVNGFNWVRNFTADLVQEGTDWVLKQLVELNPTDPRAEGEVVEVGEDKELNKTKLNEMKNALDDLKISGVFRKPEGVSATLKASEDLLANEEALRSLGQRGFYPVTIGTNGETEILSANGELAVTLKDGVKYLLRFGNIASVEGEESESSEEGDEDAAGVNRYLFVTTMVDDSKFPPPDLKQVPQTVEELDAMLNPPQVNAFAEEPQPEPVEPKEEPAGEEEMKEEPASETEESTEPVSTEPAEESAEEPAMEEEEAAEEKPAEEKAAEEEPSEEKPSDEPAVEETEGETEAEGSGEVTGAGQALLQDDDDEAAEDTPAVEEKEAEDESAEEAKPAAESDDAESDDAESDDAEPDDAEPEMTDEERQELLEAEQEKITKENQRKLDARKDQIEEAKLKVRQLNERFADWYYVIPESTYTQLHIKREELFKEDAAEADNSDPLSGGPQIQIPGFPGMNTP